MLSSDGAILLTTTIPLVLGVWHWTLLAASFAAACGTVVHVLLYKRDPRSAAYWVALVLLVPLLGAILYALFGINFIRRRGRQLREAAELTGPRVEIECPLTGIDGREDDCGLAVALARLSRMTFTQGNRVEHFVNGDAAVPVMLEAIHGAMRSITMSTYIFEASGVGSDFVEALAAAVRRGVEVRVMVDDAGTRYSWPPVTRRLREVGVPVCRFMPNRWVLRLLTLNLRNHRKIMVIDGMIGFTGGMNIREGNMLHRNPAHPVRDLHFRVQGPVVAQMQRIFAEDWAYCSGETLSGALWFPTLSPAGPVTAIGIPDGPDEDREIMPAALFAALGAARKEVKILTPYFLPPPTLSWALNLCALRGVEVTIITPRQNNIPPVGWAARTLYPELLQRGCRVFESPPPFDHSKIFLIDDVWSFVGSTNWDPRSLRLNFEFNLACHDRALAAALSAEFDRKLAECSEATLAELESASVGERLRNGVARLFIPLL